jgi:beta-N-acetylhexosaminidase
MIDRAVRRLVNAVVVPGLCGETVPDWIVRQADAGVAAVCWFSGTSLAGLVERCPGVLVLADEEGGNVTRLEADTGSSWPGNAALGVLDDVSATERVAAGIGAMARRAGIDVVLAPVVDVNSEPDNPVIGVRSFGSDSALVARHGAAFVRGLQSQGVAACAKHFPGHGATRTDSHLALPIVDADRATFLRRDVAPYAAAIAAGVRCILTAHVAVPAVDEAPATMSAAWIAHLRGDLGFDGVVISDALDMHAISRGVGRGPGAVRALAAGVDLVCIGNPCFPEPYDGEVVFDEVRRHIEGAVADGSLPVARVEEAAGRAAALATTAADPEATTTVPEDASAFGDHVAARVVRAVGEVRLAAAPHVLVEQRHDIAAGRLPSPVAAAVAARSAAATSVTVQAAAEVAAAIAAAGDRPVVLVTDGLAGSAVLTAVRAERRDAVVVHTGPAPTVDPPAVLSWGNGAANARAVAAHLLGPG